MGKRRTGRKRKVQSKRRQVKPEPAARKSGKRVFVVIIIVCAAVAGVWGILQIRNGGESSGIEGAGKVPAEQPIQPTIPPEPRVEEQITELKQEEMTLGQSVTKDYPGNTEALFLLGNVYRNQGTSEKAAECWERCLEINPDDARAYDNLGRIAFQKANYEKALELWQKASEINPKLEKVYHSLGGTLACLGRTEEAVSMFLKDIEISSQPIQSQYMLGSQYQLLKEYEKAKKCFETVIEMQPNHTNAYHGLASVCAMTGDKEKAKEYMEKFRNSKAAEMKALKERDRRFDDLASARRSAAATNKDIGRFYYERGDTLKAEELWQRAAALDPDQSECRILLASLYEGDGRIAEALRCYEEISRIEPDNLNCHRNIGVICFELKRYDEAEKAFRKVIELEPNQSFGYRDLAFLYLSTNKKIDEARGLAEKAVALEKTGDNLFVFSIACDTTGDQAGAIRAIKEAMELEPENETYKKIYEQLKKEN